jgi:cbb3-type cytochrome oxidase subunit 3
MAMDIVAVIGSATTVVSVAAFVAVVAWAWSARRKRAFDEAANAPFALPDDGDAIAPARQETTR